VSSTRIVSPVATLPPLSAAPRQAGGGEAAEAAVDVRVAEVGRGGEAAEWVCGEAWQPPLPDEADAVAAAVEEWVVEGGKGEAEGEAEEEWVVERGESEAGEVVTEPTATQQTAMAAKQDEEEAKAEPMPPATATLLVEAKAEVKVAHVRVRVREHVHVHEHVDASRCWCRSSSPSSRASGMNTRAR